MFFRTTLTFRGFLNPLFPRGIQNIWDRRHIFPTNLTYCIHICTPLNVYIYSGAPAAEGRQAEPHTHISGAPAAEGRQAEPHTHIRKLKGTHELIFSCVSWLAVLLVGAYARRRRRRRRRWWSRATWRPQLTRKPKRGFSFRGLSL